jgi:hypothetical protein
VDPVVALDKVFDAARIQAEVTALLSKYRLDPLKTYTLNHRAVTTDVIQQLNDFPGSLDHRKNGKTDVGADEFTALHPGLLGTYVEQVINEMRMLSEHPIGRIRWAVLAPKSCYSYHVDADPIRYHVPIQTHARRCFFVVDDVVFNMPEPGRVYALNVALPHTAVNAMAQGYRTHLLFDTYDPADPFAYTHRLGQFKND